MFYKMILILYFQLF